ncbi:MAG: GYDIA family GHMP kinase [Oceanihabitans sp.]
MQKFYSSGKLLLTGEYVVLDGALSLAVPSKFGQYLQVESTETSGVLWKSYDVDANLWFEDLFTFQEISTGFSSRKNPTSLRLLKILHTAKQLNPAFLNSEQGYKITTHLDFPNNWGLGTSSTLINNIANWALVDAYKLLEKTFGGSGYDIACARSKTVITYQLNNNNRTVKPITYNPDFKDQLYFVHLNKKQNSRDGIALYHKNKVKATVAIPKINAITNKIITCTSLDEFDVLLMQHEQIISEIINVKPVKEQLFSDFKGSVKSLGAWGGDFVLVTAKTNPTTYFKNKGFNTVLKYKEMLL